MPSILSKMALTAAALTGLYCVAVGLLTVPDVQRSAFYAHHVNPTHFQDLSDVEQFGFFRHQVQPFTLRTPDNVTIYAWHIIPTNLYLEHEDQLKAQRDFGLKTSDQLPETLHFKLLQDTNAHVVVSFHGNAAHLGSSWRPITCQAMLGISSPQRPVHVITFDYRGFGLSTGWPTEEGVLTDCTSLMSFLTGFTKLPTDGSGGLGVHPSRVVLLGQSLGTATSTGLYHRWTLEWGLPPFRGLILMASFASLPKVVRTYSFKGLTPPFLSPLRMVPFVHTWVISHAADRWDTERRLAELTAASEVDISVTLLHAKNDGDIPWQEGWEIWQAIMTAANGTGTLSHEDNGGGDDGIEILKWDTVDRRKRARWERVMHGGHNRVATSEQAKAAVLRVLDS